MCRKRWTNCKFEVWYDKVAIWLTDNGSKVRTRDPTNSWRDAHLKGIANKWNPRKLVSGRTFNSEG